MTSRDRLHEHFGEYPKRAMQVANHEVAPTAIVFAETQDRRSRPVHRGALYASCSGSHASDSALHTRSSASIWISPIRFVMRWGPL